MVLPKTRRITLAALISAACLPSRREDVIYLPSAADVVARMLSLARVGAEDVVFDLGCGDGRIVIAGAQERGARGVCNDIDPARIEESRRNAESAGVADRIRLEEGDLFELDLREATVVALYLSPAINRRLRPKLFRELRPGTRVVSHNFDMGEWRPDSTVRIDWPSGTTSAVHLWILPADVAGTWEVRLAGVAGNRTYRLRLDQAFQRLGGTASHAGHTVALADARISGDSIALALTDTVLGSRVLLDLRGRLAGGDMAGRAAVRGDSAAGRWRALRPY